MGTAASRRLLPEGLAVTGLAAEPDCLSIRATTEIPRARCPVCGRRSARIHSRYGRAIADLPWRGLAVRLEIRARKFFCDEPSCERRIFCERLPDVAAHARKTDRLEEALRAIVVELGGRAGARLAGELGFVVGRDALLWRAKRSVPAHMGKVRVLGVDDFAFRKGHTYDTVLVDLERRKVVDMLPERYPNRRGFGPLRAKLWFGYQARRVGNRSAVMKRPLSPL